ncbi:CoA transferase [Actinomadura vinacea]|uniref:CoA transferase n=1 Tax=Actinomadura vinacea TaxID=115336 RepID=A0ABN3IGE9_9ACTN
MTARAGAGQLAGVKVVELAHVIAGPLAGTLLADLGADVVHVEAPGTGDTARRQGPAKDGVHLWWKVAGRNKRSVTLDLRTAAGRDLARELVAWADVLITNMRPDTLRGWGLDWETLHAAHPRLVMLQITGNGASTSVANEPGFGKVGEARSGVVHLTGFPDGPPVHTGFSHGDSVTALMGAYGICAALVRRHEPDFTGEWIDLALFEPLFRLIEWQVIVADQLGVTPARAGNQLAVAPAAVVNTFHSADEVWITVTSGTPRSVRNIAVLLGEPAAEYATVEQQTARKERLDTLLRAWIGARNAADALAEMTAAEVTASRVYTAADILADPVYAEREDIVEVDDPELGPVRMQAVVPRMAERPGRVWRTGPDLGEDNGLVLGEWLGHSAEEIEKFRAAKVI